MKSRPCSARPAASAGDPASAPLPAPPSVSRDRTPAAWTLLVAGALMVLGLGACGSNETRTPADDDAAQVDVGDAGGDAGADVDATGPDTSEGCTSDDACDEGQACVLGVCRDGCANEFDCAPPTPFCDGELAVCVGCVVDADCGSNERCDAESRSCELQPGACRTSRDCAGGERCDDGLCAPIAPTICEPDATRCEGSTLVRCSDDGTSETEEPCEAPSRCEDDGEGSARCEAPVCEPNEIGCLDDATAFYCDGTGFEATPVPCDGAFYCAEGVCRPQVCEPDAASCEANVWVTCDALGSERTRTDCSDPDVCGGDRSCACTEAGCAEIVCAPGAQRCDAEGRSVCSADGTAWEAIEGCGDEEACVDGACLPIVCEAGTVVCAGETLTRCDEAGTAPSLVDCRDEGQICETIDGEAGCVDPVCTPGLLACEPGNVAVTCDGRGAVRTETPCEDDEYCRNGACFEKVCEPGDAPVCVGGDVRRCDALGSDFELVESCPAGTSLCVDGACALLVCTPSSRTCDDDVLDVCSADGLTLTTTDCAAEGAFCDAGACQPRVCDPEEASVCEGGNAVGCDARGTERVIRQVCLDGLCEDGACTSTCGDGVLDAGEACDLGARNGDASGCALDCTLDLESLCDAGDCVVLDGDVDSALVSVSVAARPLDVGILLDASASMDSTIQRLATQYATVLVPALETVQSDVRVGIASFQDFPCAGAGAAPEVPFWLHQRMTAQFSDVGLGLSGIVAQTPSGGSFDMSLAEALYQAATGAGRVEPACGPVPWEQAPFDPAANMTRGTIGGTDGGMGARPRAFRVLTYVVDDEIWAKDVPGEGMAFGATWSETWQALRRGGYFVVGVEGSASWEGTRDGIVRVADAVGPRVPPCFWGASRPPGCAAGQCCTGANRAGQAPDADGLCSLGYGQAATTDQTILLLAEGVRAAYEHGAWSATLRPERALDESRSPDCLVEAVRPVSATRPPGACGVAPTPTRVAVPGAGPNDGFEGVRMRSTLRFDVELGDGSCLPPSPEPRAFDLELQLVTRDGWVIQQQPLRVVMPPTADCGTARCGPGLCGNGVREAGEGCDDGNLDAGDGCSPTCRVESCGNGVIDRTNVPVRLVRPRLAEFLGAEAAGALICDDGASCVHGSCDLRELPDAPEHALCQALGFDRAIEVEWGRGEASVPAEAGFQATGDARCFDTRCEPAADPSPQVTCGAWELLEAITCAGRVEACDDGAANSDGVAGACRRDCTLPACGDGIVDPGEDCDDGNDNDDDGCSNACREPFCGDGRVQGDEVCDDGNDIDDDACTNDCELGPAWQDCIDEDIGRVVGVAVAAGSTSLQTDDWKVSCGITSTTSGTDASLLWTAPSAGRWEFSTDGSTFDTVLKIFDPVLGGSCDPFEIACDDDGGESTRSLTVVPLAANQRVQIIVDGWSASATGDWVLNIRRVGD